MQRTKWVERTFTFDFPAGWIFNILERLRGTPARISEIILSLSEEDATFKPNGKWSIKENIGHLSDLEELHDGRIDDFIARKEILRAADMSNTKTFSANHNAKTIDELVKNFSLRRKQFITGLSDWTMKHKTLKSMHPRLKVLMRPVDVAYFTAEHDDHHLAAIRAILNLDRNLK
jgi:hypothetical protein